MFGIENLIGSKGPESWKTWNPESFQKQMGRGSYLECDWRWAQQSAVASQLLTTSRTHRISGSSFKKIIQYFMTIGFFVSLYFSESIAKHNSIMFPICMGGTFVLKKLEYFWDICLYLALMLVNNHLKGLSN